MTDSFESDPMTADDLAEAGTIKAHRDALVADSDLQALAKRALEDLRQAAASAARGALAAGEASLPVVEALTEAAVRGLVAGQLDQLKGRFGG